ncbi:MAG: sulfite exporter TauE/SafE family protein [Betaproteobacteria bacterium]|nr:sulfite exporter TauE/SafE family protein [Betaproteobacteria bacterium]
MDSPRVLRRARLLAAGAILMAAAAPALGADGAALPWWSWPLMLFAVTFAMGVIAVIAGVGGGVLFVPIVGGLFPFHLDFVRATGLLLALSGAMSAGPSLLRSGMASLRLAMPLALVASLASVGGALLGFALPTRVVQGALGATIMAIAVLMWRAKGSLVPHVAASDALGARLALHGRFVDASDGQEVHWRTHRTSAGIAVSALIGVLGGMFGLGAGWANVPALNLLMGAPFKVSVATSGLLISIANSSAAWVYLHKGAVVPLIAVPSIVGVMAGARLGAHLLGKLPARAVRQVVVALLAAAGLRALLAGLGIWE